MRNGRPCVDVSLIFTDEAASSSPSTLIPPVNSFSCLSLSGVHGDRSTKSHLENLMDVGPCSLKYSLKLHFVMTAGTGKQILYVWVCTSAHKCSFVQFQRAKLYRLHPINQFMTLSNKSWSLCDIEYTLCVCERSLFIQRIYFFKWVWMKFCKFFCQL